MGFFVQWLQRFVQLGIDLLGALLAGLLRAPLVAAERAKARELWGKKDRITGCLKTLASYGGAAKPVLPRLRELERALTGHREARSLSEQIELCRRTLSAIESDGEGPPLRTVTDLVRPKRRESP